MLGDEWDELLRWGMSGLRAVSVGFGLWSRCLQLARQDLDACKCPGISDEREGAGRLP